MQRATDILFFWAAWIILPLLVEIIPSIGNFFVLVRKKIRLTLHPIKDLGFKPSITLIIPVYNSGGTLYRCIESIYLSTYPVECIEVLLVDNGSKDNSFDEFQRAQIDFPDLGMWWIYSNQGKSKALNKAIYNSNGKYIMNIDSDGILQQDALYNMVKQFEAQPDVDCMAGVILIEPALIEKTKGFTKRMFRRMEFMEYAQAFLAGRNFESEHNSMYTLAGAFSAFRKSLLVNTYLYNTNTICEDTHISFQVRDVLKRKMRLCPNAIFMVDPIENLNKFYTQRQRWQIGELEVANMFMKNKMKNPLIGFFTSTPMRLIILDHTFAFPRMIWYFALFAVGCINYNFSNVIKANILIYALYVLVAFLYFCNVTSFLDEFKDLQKYYMRNIICILFMPLYNLFSFFVRFAGIINSIKRKSSWKTKTFTEEMEECTNIVTNDWTWIYAIRRYVIGLLEVSEG